MLCQLSGTYLNHFVLLTVLQLLNLNWKHIYVQNDNDSVPSNSVPSKVEINMIKLYINIFKL